MHNPTLRVISVLNLISTAKSGLSLAECSRSLHIPSGTLYPILQTLYMQKYLNYDEHSYRYTVGSRLFFAGINYVSNSQPYENAQKVLRRIVNACGETAHWGVLEAGDVLYFATALGKALLSRFSLEELNTLYPQGLEAVTESTVTNIAKLYEQLQCVKKDGFAYEWEESNKHICCIAVPVLIEGNVVSALSVAVPVFRYTEEKKECIKNCLIRAAEEAVKIMPYLNLSGN